MDHFSNFVAEKSPSSDINSQSEDEITGHGYETVETVPLRRDNQSQYNALNQASMASLRPDLPTQHTNTARLTQPTQIIHRSPPPATLSSPTNTTVQVAASSPIPTPVPTRKASGILANSLMAPAGTTLRRPFAAPLPKIKPITIDSDDEGPTYKGGSSDDDEGIRRSDIKTTTFQRRQADTIPESPAKGGNNLFKSIISGSAYDGQSNGVKRSADAMASAYGNSSSFKKPRQTGPSRALPVMSSPEADIDLDDIDDPNIRRKIKRMTSFITHATNRQCFDALTLKRGQLR